MYVVFIRTKYNKLPRNEKGKNSWVFILQIEAFYIKQKKTFIILKSAFIKKELFDNIPTKSFIWIAWRF